MVGRYLAIFINANLQCLSNITCFLFFSFFFKYKIQDLLAYNYLHNLFTFNFEHFFFIDLLIYLIILVKYCWFIILGVHCESGNLDEVCYFFLLWSRLLQ